jgi:dTDP-glucose 4,6-dehydratase
MDELAHNHLNAITHYEILITFVKDSNCHDIRYAINASKIDQKLYWKQRKSVESVKKKSVKWYLRNVTRWTQVLDGDYLGERLRLDS